MVGKCLTIGLSVIPSNLWFIYELIVVFTPALLVILPSLSPDKNVFFHFAAHKKVFLTSPQPYLYLGPVLWQTNIEVVVCCKWLGHVLVLGPTPQGISPFSYHPSQDLMPLTSTLSSVNWSCPSSWNYRRRHSPKYRVVVLNRSL